MESASTVDMLVGDVEGLRGFGVMGASDSALAIAQASSCRGALVLVPYIGIVEHVV